MTHRTASTIAQDIELGPDEYVVWAPFPGFQEEVLSASEFEVFIGGAKGPGKSDLIYVKSAMQVALPEYKGLVLRESYTEIEELIRRAKKTFGAMGAKWQAKERQFQWYGSTTVGSAYQGGTHLGLVKFGYCSRLEDVETYQGQEWAYIGVDEAANLVNVNKIIEDLIKEIRCPNPDVMLQFMASGNPGFAGQGQIKRRYIDACGRLGERIYEYEVEIPVFDGGREVGTTKVKRHRRFIPGRVQDNPIYANDQHYMATLASLPEERKRQMLLGDWDAGMGMALSEVSLDTHLCQVFEPQPFWEFFGAFDWGFNHRWVFGGYAVSPTGQVYKLDTLTGRKEYPPDIANKVLGRFPDAANWYLVSGTDLWSKPLHLGADVPSRYEEFLDLGLPFTKADTRPGSRISSLNNLRQWTKLTKRADGELSHPGLLFMDTPGNRWCVEQLMEMVTDPKNPEDALKVDVDSDTGEGGDDGYDETRMGMMTRPFAPLDPEVTPAHHQRIHKRAAEIMKKVQERQDGDMSFTVSEDDEAMLPEDMQGDPWGDVYG